MTAAVGDAIVFFLIAIRAKVAMPVRKRHREILVIWQQAGLPASGTYLWQISFLL